MQHDYNKILTCLTVILQNFTVVLHASPEIAKYFTRRPLASTQRMLTTYDYGAVGFAVTATGNLEILHEVKKWVPDLLVRSPHLLAMKARKIVQAFAEAQVKM